MVRVTCAVLVAAVVVQSVAAQDWTQWRGPTRNGVVSSTSSPREWPAAVRPAWRVDVGEGYSSPVVSSGRAFVHSRRDPDEVVSAIDLASGKVVWRQTYPASFSKNQYAVGMAKGPNSTPLVAAGRLFTLGATGILSAWSVDTGALQWRNDYSASVDTSKLFCGTSISPLIEDGGLVVQVGSDVHGGRVIVLDPASGKERWTWHGPGPGYASPIGVSIGATRQIITFTQESIVGLDAKSGALLWSVPFPDEWHENIVTPVWTGSHLIVSGTRKGTRGYAVVRNGEKWEAVERWTNAEISMYMSTPVAADGLVYGHAKQRKGQFVALDAETGALRWASEGREGDHASVLLTPDHVLFLTSAGKLVVVRRRSARFDETRRYDAAEGGTWAMPVLLADGVVLRDAAALVRLTFATQG